VEQLDRPPRGIAHGNLDGLRVLVTTTATLRSTTSAPPTPAASSTGSTATTRILVLTAQLVGEERAIAAAVAVPAKSGWAAVIPVVQPARSPAGLTKAVKHQGKELKKPGPRWSRHGARTSPRSRSSGLSCSSRDAHRSALRRGIAFHSMEASTGRG